MRFKEPKHYLLLGGGEALVATVSMLAERKLPCTVGSSKRLLVEKAGSATLSAALSERKTTVLEANTAAELLSKLEPSLIADTMAFSFGAPWIFKKDFIAAFEGRFLNFHGSQLPRNRGGGGFSWRILEGFTLGYCLAHVMEEGVDTGAIVLKEEFVHSSECRTPEDYTREVMKRLPPFIGRLIDGLHRGDEFHLEDQDEHRSTYWPRLHTEYHGWIDWAWEAADLERFIRAFDEPYAGAHTLWNGAPVYLKGCCLSRVDGAFHPFQAGIVYRKEMDRLCVAAKGGSVFIRSARSAGGEDLLPKIRIGDRFFTPRATLDAALDTRIQYAADGRVLVQEKKK